jgi:RNA polymerase sigma-70 factor (ECF subfamily)
MWSLKMPENDGFYVQRCLDGHPDDFRHLVRRYKGPVLGYLAGQLGRSDLAEEALQEVFVRCYFGLSALEKPESFFAWMLGVANRVAKEQVRTEQKERQVAEKLAQMPAQSGGGFDKLAAGGRDWPLAKTVAKLDDFSRQLILLRYYGGRTCKDVATIMNIPIGTVTKSLSRAYTRLRDMLKDEAAQESEVQL